MSRAVKAIALIFCTLVCTTSLAFWLITTFRRIQIAHVAHQNSAEFPWRQWHVAFEGGQVQITVTRLRSFDVDRAKEQLLSISRPLIGDEHLLLAFGYQRYSYYWHPGVVLFFPLWLPVILSAIPPGLFFARRLRRRVRTAAGCCERCGYDLRASPDRCPECGMQPETPIAVPATSHPSPS